MSELKPCPFCGGKAEEDTHIGGVVCENYCTNPNTFDGGGGVWTTDWNARPIEDALNKRIAELEAEVAELKPYRDGYDPEKVGLRGQILAEALTKNIIAREVIQQLLTNPFGCRFCDYGVLRKPDNPLKGHDEDCPYLAAHAYLDNETSTVVKRELTDAEITRLENRFADTEACDGRLVEQVEQLTAENKRLKAVLNEWDMAWLTNCIAPQPNGNEAFGLDEGLVLCARMMKPILEETRLLLGKAEVVR